MVNLASKTVGQECILHIGYIFKLSESMGSFEGANEAIKTGFQKNSYSPLFCVCLTRRMHLTKD
jgi:hypothetical protein